MSALSHSEAALPVTMRHLGLAYWRGGCLCLGHDFGVEVYPSRLWSICSSADHVKSSLHIDPSSLNLWYLRVLLVQGDVAWVIVSWPVKGTAVFDIPYCLVRDIIHEVESRIVYYTMWVSMEQLHCRLQVDEIAGRRDTHQFLYNKKKDVRVSKEDLGSRGWQNLFSEACDERALPLAGCRSESVRWEGGWEGE